jgi:hypothetical protein
MNVMVSLVVVNVACLGGVNVAGDRCGVRVVVGRRGGGRVGREVGDQAFASFLICLTSLSKQGLQNGAGEPSALSRILECLQVFGSHLPH